MKSLQTSDFFDTVPRIVVHDPPAETLGTAADGVDAGVSPEPHPPLPGDPFVGKPR